MGTVLDPQSLRVFLYYWLSADKLQYLKALFILGVMYKGVGRSKDVTTADGLWVGALNCESKALSELLGNDHSAFIFRLVIA